MKILKIQIRQSLSKWLNQTLKLKRMVNNYPIAVLVQTFSNEEMVGLAGVDLEEVDRLFEKKYILK